MRSAQAADGDSTTRFSVEPSAPVSAQSVFADRVWKLGVVGDERDASKPPALLQLNWDRISEGLSHGLVLELQLAAYLNLKGRLTLKSGARKEFKPVTVVSYTKRLATLLRSATTVVSVESIAYLSISALQAAIDRVGDHLGVRAALRSVVQPLVRERLPNGHLLPTDWEVCSTLKWNGREEGFEGYEPLSDALFILLSERSQACLTKFLCAMGVPICDASAKVEESEELASRYPRFKEMVATYREGKGTAPRSRRRRPDEATLTLEFAARFGVERKMFRQVLFDAQDAAITFILLYTGMRSSEARLLRRGCVTALGNNYVIVGTMVKHQPRRAPFLCDRWVATDALVDAVHVLEEIANISGSNFLMSSLEPERGDGHRVTTTRRPFNYDQLGKHVEQYLRRVDVESRFSDDHIHPHMFRSGLARQLAKVRLKLPYISMQLKHLSYAGSEVAMGLPHKVTLAYGNLARTLLDTATGAEALKEAKEMQALSLYGEGRQFAGGGARNHKLRIDAFFQGLGLSGTARDDYIRSRAAKGIPLFHTGFGVCGLNIADPTTIQSAPPPCFGDLHCNPSDCSNAVVPEYNRAAIQWRAKSATAKGVEAIDPNVRTFHEGVAWRYKSMLDQLDGRRD
jgi:hypothetical protein